MKWQEKHSFLIARCLGYGGAIPFVGLSLAILFSTDTPSDARQWLFGYGVVILSFLGGLHWGRIAAQTEQPPQPLWLVYSTLPSLIGWFAWMMPASVGIGMLAGGFILCAIVDLQLVRKGVFASWMSELRLMLSAIALLSLLSLHITL